MNPARNKNTEFLRRQVLKGWRKNRGAKQIAALINKANARVYHITETVISNK
jgi:hypothetical protein